MNAQVAPRDRFGAFQRFNAPSLPSSSNIRLEDDGSGFEEGKVKTRLLSMWNNVKYGKRYLSISLFLWKVRLPKYFGMQQFVFRNYRSYFLSRIIVLIGMKLKTNFSKESPVWLLGRCYHKKTGSPLSESTELGTDVAAFQSQDNVIPIYLNYPQPLL